MTDDLKPGLYALTHNEDLGDCAICVSATGAGWILYDTGQCFKCGRKLLSDALLSGGTLTPLPAPAELVRIVEASKECESALRDIREWDDDLEFEWGDPGNRANHALIRMARIEDMKEDAR